MDKMHGFDEGHLWMFSRFLVDRGTHTLWMDLHVGGVELPVLAKIRWSNHPLQPSVALGSWNDANKVVDFHGTVQCEWLHDSLANCYVDLYDVNGDVIMKIRFPIE